MNYYYITGTSRGIGKAIATQLLEDSTNSVIGISRQSTITHANYKHLYLDLSDANSFVDFKFDQHSDAKKICLINNAGTLGSIKSVGKLEASNIIKSYTLNLIAPGVLINSFINCYESEDAEKIILNVSSGAGKRPIDGWSVYCATKSGIDMFSQVVDAEQKIKANKNSDKHKGFKIFSIAPGQVNTEMQDEVRTASEYDFSELNNFVQSKLNNQLLEPEFVAKKYVKILADVSEIKNVLSSLNEYM